MKIAVIGCGHGELDNIYQTALHSEEVNNIKIDLIIVCGDFQAVRSKHDLNSLAVPNKYRKMMDFWKYHNGDCLAPILTIFIGGNHEASNYLQELPFGGYVAHNIYYMGYAGIVNINGVRIGGLSGIYNRHTYSSVRHEHPPYDDNSIRTVYHYRKLEIQRLLKNSSPIDIMFSHDWPSTVCGHGDLQLLLQRKPFFYDDISSQRLGSPPLDTVLHDLKPSFWFSAHLHVHFAAHVQHSEGVTTKFLALDKCLPGRRFMQLVEVVSDHDGPPTLSFDKEWLSILRKTNGMSMHELSACGKMGREETDDWMKTFTDDDYIIPVVSEFGDLSGGEFRFVPNGQNVNFCDTFGVTDPNEGLYWVSEDGPNPDEIHLSD